MAIQLVAKMKRHIALNQEILSLFLRNKGGAKVYCEK